MRVWCLSNQRRDLSDLTTPWPQTFGIGAPPDLRTDVEPGKEYVVYALWWWDGVPGYGLCGEHYSRFPTFYPAELFKVTDARPSRHWRVGHWSWPESRRRKFRSEVFIGPPEWGADPGFYERVVDGDPATQAIWVRYKQLLDEETGDARVGDQEAE